MSLILQNPLFNSTFPIKLYSLNNNNNNINKTSTHFNNPIKPLNFSLIYNHPIQFNTYPLHKTFTNHFSFIKPLNSSLNSIQEQQQNPQKPFNFDSFLSFLESLFVISSVLISIGCLVNWVFFKRQNNGVLLLLGSKVLVWVLAGAVGVGSVIRRRQWSRVCGPGPGSENGNVVERIEELEESLRSVTSIVRMLSRQLEKLGVRFRVTRKALKDPISETAALAQKNSEATRALAAQESILEKELGEVQKVLLAMQDQQQKQLELILAIAKSGKLFESKQPPSQGSGTNSTVSDNGSRQLDGHQIQSMVSQKGSMNDIASGS